MSESSRKNRVLIVEDEEVSQKILANLCEKLGITPTLATTAEEAKTALASNYFDLILMDVGLPGLSGIEFTKEIRAKENGKDNRSLIVAITGMDAKEGKNKCIEAGMDGFFPKPLNRMMFWTFLQKIFK
jgi:CheY-like chemotaxis protein